MRGSVLQDETGICLGASETEASWTFERACVRMCVCVCVCVCVCLLAQTIRRRLKENVAYKPSNSCNIQICCLSLFTPPVPLPPSVISLFTPPVPLPPSVVSLCVSPHTISSLSGQQQPANGTKCPLREGSTDYDTRCPRA